MPISCCDKTLTKINLRGECLFQLTGYSCSSREAEAGLNARAKAGSRYCLAFHYSIQPSHPPRGGTTHNGCIIPHQSLGTSPTDRPTSQSAAGDSPAEVLLSQVTLACFKVAEANQHRTLHVHIKMLTVIASAHLFCWSVFSLLLMMF